MKNTRGKTLIKYVIPSILSNACIFLFTIVDGVFVGRGVGSDALGAVNIAMPVVMIATAVNMLTSIGGCAIVAIRLGQNDKAGANQAFLHSLTANVALAALITLVCTLLTGPLSRFLGADDFYLPMVKEYVFWWGLFAIPSALSVNFQFFCRNDGSPALVAVATVVSTALNIFLDWLFVFPMQMGIMGAAIATGISQTAGWLVAAMHFILRKGDLRIRFFKPQMKMFGQIIFFGLPEMIAQFATPVTTICLNTVIVASLGEIGVNAFAVISYVASLAVSVFSGAAEGLQPLFGQTYGAKEEKDMKWYFRSGMLISFVGSIVIVGLCVLFGRPICALFGADAETLEYTLRYLPQYAWAFVVVGLNTMISAYLYSTERSGYAIPLNICRALVFNTLVIRGLPALAGEGIIWYTYGIAECAVLVLAVILLKVSERNGIRFEDPQH